MCVWSNPPIVSLPNGDPKPGFEKQLKFERANYRVFDATHTWICESYRKLLAQQQIMQWGQMAGDCPDVENDISRMLTRLKANESTSTGSNGLLDTVELKETMLVNDSAAIAMLSIPTSEDEDRKFLASLHRMDPPLTDEPNVPILHFHSLSSSRSDGTEVKKKSTTKKTKPASELISS